MTRRKQVRINGLALSYLHQPAEKPDAPKLLFLHGLASSAATWQLVISALGSGFDCYSLDQRGHGHSDKPAGPYSVEAVAADAIAFIEQVITQKAAVIGQSWGGNVALQLVANRPDLVSHLAMIDGGFIEMQLDPAATWEEVSVRLAPPVLAGMSVDEFRERFKTWSLFGDNPAAAEAVLCNFLIDSENRIKPRLSGENHMLVLRGLWEHRPSQLYRSVRSPVLVVIAVPPADRQYAAWSSDVKTEMIRRLAKSLPDAKIKYYADTAHDAQLHRPAQLATDLGEQLAG